MARQYANINPEILIWARKTVKLSTWLAAEKIGVNEDKLLSWEDGSFPPTIKQLYKIADAYRRPFALFYFPKPPKHFKPLKDFRKFTIYHIHTEPEEYQLQKELLLFQRKREQALELYDLLEKKIPIFKIKAKLNEDSKEVAKRIIKELKINHKKIANTSPGYDALNYWKSFLETKGILIFQTTKVPLEVMRGACIVKNELPVLIINSNDSQNGRIFSLFHELVHIVLKETGISNFRFSNKELYDFVEVFCNQVAAEILVPTELLINTQTVKNHKKSEENWTHYELKNLSTLFCVSQEVIYRRLLTLGKSSENSYKEFRENNKDKRYNKPKGGNYYRNIIAKNGRHFLNLALQGYYQEKLTASSLYDCTKVKLSNLSKLEDKLYV